MLLIKTLPVWLNVLSLNTVIIVPSYFNFKGISCISLFKSEKEQTLKCLGGFFNKDEELHVHLHTVIQANKSLTSLFYVNLILLIVRKQF
jgi:hypothetical protein